MVNPLGTPGSHSFCLPPPPASWGLEGVMAFPLSMDPFFWYREEVSVPGLGGPLLAWLPLAKGWVSLALVPLVPMKFPLLGLLPMGVRCPWSACHAHGLLATGRAGLSWSLPATGSLPRTEL